ncbi:hypothetical protein V2J09_014342 [Rumex salicifolius]
MALSGTRFSKRIHFLGIPEDQRNKLQNQNNRVNLKNLAINKLDSTASKSLDSGHNLNLTGSDLSESSEIKNRGLSIRVFQL